MKRRTQKPLVVSNAIRASINNTKRRLARLQRNIDEGNYENQDHYERLVTKRAELDRDLADLEKAL